MAIVVTSGGNACSRIVAELDEAGVGVCPSSAVKIDNEPPLYDVDEAMKLLNREHLTQRKHPKNPRK